MSDNKSALVPIVLTCIGYAFFCISDSAVKILATQYHFSQLLVVMGLMMGAIIITHASITQGRSAFHVLQWKWVLLRAAFGGLCSLSNIFAFPHVQLTTFYTLVFTSPFWVALLSAVFLKEKLTVKSMATITFGFAVVAYVFQPGSGLLNAWTLVVLLASFLYSCSMIAVRKAGPLESRTMLVLCAPLAGVIVGLPLLLQNWVAPELYDWGVFAVGSLTTAIGVFAITYAFQHAPSAATVAPYHYTQIIWGALLGYLLFNDVPDARVMIGAALIIGAGLYLIYSETKRPQISR